MPCALIASPIGIPHRQGTRGQVAVQARVRWGLAPAACVMLVAAIFGSTASRPGKGPPTESASVVLFLLWESTVAEKGAYVVPRYSPVTLPVPRSLL